MRSIENSRKLRIARKRRFRPAIADENARIKSPYVRGTRGDDRGSENEHRADKSSRCLARKRRPAEKRRRANGSYFRPARVPRGRTKRGARHRSTTISNLILDGSRSAVVEVNRDLVGLPTIDRESERLPRARARALPSALRPAPGHDPGKIGRR